MCYSVIVERKGQTEEKKMKLKIGFADRKEEPIGEPETAAPIVTEPRKSVVRVFFEARGFACSYYNDRFDLHEGDIVFVEGKLEGLRGRVTEVSYNFKIRLSDYKRVTAKADAEVHGKFYPLADGFVSFDKSAIDGNKMKSRYIAPSDGEYVTGDGETKTLSLGELEQEMSYGILSQGAEICENSDIAYITLENGTVSAAVADGKRYREIEFLFENDRVGGFNCDCYSTGICAHCAAVALKLRKLLKELEKNFGDEYKYGGDLIYIGSDGFFELIFSDGKKRGITV